MAANQSQWSGILGVGTRPQVSKDYSKIWDYSGYGSPLSTTVARPGASQAGSGYGVPFEQAASKPNNTGLMGAPFAQATPPAAPTPGFGGVPGLTQYSTNPDISAAANAALGRYNAIVGGSKTTTGSSGGVGRSMGGLGSQYTGVGGHVTKSTPEGYPPVISEDQRLATNAMRTGMTGEGGQFAQENLSMKDWATQMLGASKAGTEAADKMTSLSDQEANATRGIYTGEYLKSLQDEAARSESLANQKVANSLASLGAARNAQELTGVGGSSIARDSQMASVAGRIALQNALQEAATRRANILAATEAQRSFYGLAPSAVASANAVRSNAAMLPGQTIPVMSALSQSQQSRLGAFPGMEQANFTPTYFSPEETEARRLGLLGGYANLSNALSQYSYTTPETPTNFIVPNVGSGQYRNYGGGIGGTYIEPSWNYDVPMSPQVSQVQVQSPQISGQTQADPYQQYLEAMYQMENWGNTSPAYSGITGGSYRPTYGTAPSVVGNTAYQYNPATGQYEIVAEYNPS